MPNWNGLGKCTFRVFCVKNNDCNFLFHAKDTRERIINSALTQGLESLEFAIIYGFSTNASNPISKKISRR